MGEIFISEEIDEVFSRLSNMLWAFQRILAGKLSNWDDEAELQSKIYKNIFPETSKAVIVATHCPNHAMHNIITSVNRLPVHFLRRN